MKHYMIQKICENTNLSFIIHSQTISVVEPTTVDDTLQYCFVHVLDVYMQYLIFFKISKVKLYTDIILNKKRVEFHCSASQNILLRSLVLSA